MDYINISLFFSTLGTAAIIFTYIYLYFLYRERFMGIWAISWVILLSRYSVLDSGVLAWRSAALGLSIYQALTIISVLMLVWGTHLFINKPLKRWWIYSAFTAVISSFLLNLTDLTLAAKLIFPCLFCCFVSIWIGLMFSFNLKLRGIGHLVTGSAYIAWSLLHFVAPFLLYGSAHLPIVYLLGGILRMIIAFGTLMTYFERTRLRLVSQEKQYRMLAENAVDVIYYYQLTPTKELCYISPSVFNLTGYTPEEYYLDNKLIIKQLHSEDQILLSNFINNLPNSIELPLTLRLIQKNKETIWLEQRCVPIYDKSGNLIALEGIIRDITLRNKLMQMTSLLDRMNMVGNMAVTVAHEIRNPMTTVRGYLQLLQRKERYAADTDKFKLMIEEIDRANGILREYLSLSREKVANFKSCSLNTIIETLFPLIQVNANSSKIYTTLNLEPVPKLLLDENEIRQLLLNLTRNSIEAMPNGGSLNIRTSTKDTQVILSISDQGAGIPPHILEHLGTPFCTTKEKGTGLGVSICYQIVHRHNADIKIDTGNKGTTFSIYFPILSN